MSDFWLFSLILAAHVSLAFFPGEGDDVLVSRNRPQLVSDLTSTRQWMRLPSVLPSPATFGSDFNQACLNVSQPPHLISLSKSNSLSDSFGSHGIHLDIEHHSQPVDGVPQSKSTSTSGK